jgi:hypothetical protein
LEDNAAAPLSANLEEMDDEQFADNDQHKEVITSIKIILKIAKTVTTYYRALT